MSQGPVISFYGTSPTYVCPRVQALEISISLGHKKLFGFPANVFDSNVLRPQAGPVRKPVQVFLVSLRSYLFEMF
jgi:hypothetical protein